MKTVGFKRDVEKHEGYTVVKNPGQSYTSVKGPGDGVVAISEVDQNDLIIAVGDELMPDWLFDAAVAYARTPIEDRKEERIWVIPWGADGDGNENAWRMSNGCGPDVVIPSIRDWRNGKTYHFKDSQLEALKATQSPAIAKAIDIVKELVTND